MKKNLFLLCIILIGFTGCENAQLKETANTMQNQQSSQTNGDSKESDTQKTVEQKSNEDEEIVIKTEFTGIDGEKYLFEEIPELEKYEQYISTQSKGKAFMVVESDDEIYNVVFEGIKKEYFMVYVGEQYDGYRVNWFWFYVSRNLDEILWYELVDAEVFTLSEWRNSTNYLEKADLINK